MLTIERAVSAGQLTTPTSGHARTLTVGASTAQLWQQLTGEWAQRAGRPLGPWLFSPDATHDSPVKVAEDAFRDGVLRWSAQLRSAR